MMGTLFSCYRINTSLCGGLSLIHYHSFKVAPSLQKLKERYQNEMKEYLDHGIHVTVSQNESGEFTVGDSHEYANTFDPFNIASCSVFSRAFLYRSNLYCSTGDSFSP